MRWVIVLLVALAGCPATPADDDVPDAPPVTETALHLDWKSLPASVPADLSDELTLERVSFEIANLRIVGDTGAIDYPTTVAWGDQGPARLDFPNAPAGLYARVEFEARGADGDDDGVELRGTVETDSGSDEFKLELGDLTVSVDVALQLDPGDDRTQTITVDFGAVLEAIDFDAIPVVDGKRELDDDDPKAAAIRDQLERSFADGGMTLN